MLVYISTSRRKKILPCNLQYLCCLALCIGAIFAWNVLDISSTIHCDFSGRFDSRSFVEGIVRFMYGRHYEAALQGNWTDCKSSSSTLYNFRGSYKNGRIMREMKFLSTHDSHGKFNASFAFPMDFEDTRPRDALCRVAYNRPFNSRNIIILPLADYFENYFGLPLDTKPW